MSQASGYAAASAANLQLCRALLMITLTSSVSTASALSSTVKPAAVTLIGFMCNKLLVKPVVTVGLLQLFSATRDIQCLHSCKHSLHELVMNDMLD